MQMEAVYQAYSNRDDAALTEALRLLQRKLIGDVQSLGPAAVALDLVEHPQLLGILNKIEADTSELQAGPLAFVAGFVSAYCEHLRLLADRDAVDVADAQLSADRDSREPVDLIRMMVLKITFVQTGARAKEVVSAVARATNVSDSLVKFHIKKLVELKLIERLELGPKAVSYRISRLGEAVLARRSKPYELALFLVDQAVHDKALRAAMEDEIGRTWRKKEKPPIKAPKLPRLTAPMEGGTVLGAFNETLVAELAQYDPTQYQEGARV